MTEINKIDENLTITQKISLLNDMILAVNGKIEQAKFNKNEIDALYTDTGETHKYLRNVELGTTLATYSLWTHVHEESGYSIWSYTPTNYSYDALNQLYFDDKVLTNEGEANAVASTTFAQVYLLSGATYTDNTTEAGTEEGTEFELMDAVSDYLYIGNATTFAGVKFEFATRGSNYTLEGQYYDGTGWSALDMSGITYTDNTSNFESDGNITWTLPGDWATTTVNGQTSYWVRFYTSTVPVTVAEAYYIVPANTVIGLLAMSSSEFHNEEWKWCTCGSTIYVTIRNTGIAAYEGDYFITSSSSAANKQAFFIDNHEYKLDHLDSTYS